MINLNALFFMLHFSHFAQNKSKNEKKNGVDLTMLNVDLTNSNKDNLKSMKIKIKFFFL